MFGFAPFSVRPFSALRETSFNFLGEATVTINFEFRIYVSDKEFATSPTDTVLPSQPFFGTLSQPLSFRRSILGASLIGRYAQGSGSIQIHNTDGFYDFLIQQYAIDGREIVVKIGEQGADQSTFYTLFKGPAADWSISEEFVSIEIQDNSYKLNVPIHPDTYAGTGGLEGGDDLQGKKKPLSFGYVENISPPLVRTTHLLYQVNDGPVNAITAVYDRGVALSFDQDFANSTLLQAATIPSSNYATCLAEGFFRLGSTPAGTITADVQGDKTGGTFVYTAADIVRRIVTLATATHVTVPDDLYLPDFTLVNTLQPAELGYWAPGDQEITVADALADIMASVGGWAGFRRDGKLQVNIFRAPATTPSAFFDVVDARAIKREKAPGMSPPPALFRVGWGRNWTVQTDLGGSVTNARRAYLAEEYRFATAESSSVRLDHPFTRDPEPIRGFFRDEADAATEADRLLALYAMVRAVYRIQLGIEPFALNLGETVNVTFPRWDLSAGRNLVIVDISEDAASNSVEISGWG